VPQRLTCISGHDPQLEKAIELANEGLKNYKAFREAKVPVAK